MAVFDVDNANAYGITPLIAQLPYLMLMTPILTISKWGISVDRTMAVFDVDNANTYGITPGSHYGRI